MSGHEGGGGNEGGSVLGVTELEEASKPVWEFLANLITAFVNVFLGGNTTHH